MIQPAHLTENQWFDLCLRIYFALRVGDLHAGVALLEDTGFDLKMLASKELCVHDQG